MSFRAISDRARNAFLWAGLLTGPLVWLALLETQYVLSYVSCQTRQHWPLHLATAIAVLVVAASGWLASRSGPAEDEEPRSAPSSDGTRESRARWMSLAGLATSVSFILLILTMEIPILVLETCQ
jgi:hypothetical protein